MAAACFQLHNYDLFEKVGLKLSPLTQNSVQQDYLLSNSLLTKNIKKLLHLPGVDCPPFPWTFMGNPGDEGGGENPTQESRIYSFPPSKKSRLMDLNLSLWKISFLPHQIAIFE